MTPSRKPNVKAAAKFDLMNFLLAMGLGIFLFLGLPLIFSYTVALLAGLGPIAFVIALGFTFAVFAKVCGLI